MLITREEYRKIILLIGKKDYIYQSDIVLGEHAQNIYNNILLGLPLLIAATRRAGKTLIAAIICYFYLKRNPTKRILIVAEGKKSLKKQFSNKIIEELINTGLLPKGFVERIDDKKQFIKSKSNILIINPQTIRELIKDSKFSFIENNLNFNLLIFDEAQNWYETKNGDGLIAKLKEKLKFDNIILLTGSPSSFNGRGFPSHYVSTEDLPNERVAPMSMELVKTKSNIRKSDFNGDELKKGYSWSRSELHSIEWSMLNDLFNALVDKLMSPYKNNPEKFYLSKHGKFIDKIIINGERKFKEMFINEYLEKTLIFCHNIPQAIHMYHYLNSFIKIPILISHSNSKHKEGYDPYSETIESFEKLKENRSMLLVVDRAKEGYDDPYVVNVIDMSCSGDPELISQIIDRGGRPHPDQPNKVKTFIKIVPEGEEHYYKLSLNFAINLNRRDIFKIYNGKNFNNIGIKIVKDKDIQDSPKVDVYTRLLNENKKLKNRIKIMNVNDKENDAIDKVKIKKTPLIWLNESVFTTLNKSIQHKDGDVWSAIAHVETTAGNVLGIKEKYKSKSLLEIMEIIKHKNIANAEN